MSGKKKGSRPSKGKSGTPRVVCRIEYEIPLALKTFWNDFMEKCLVALGPGAKPADVLRRIAEEGVPGGQPENLPGFVFHGNSAGECWVSSKEGRIPNPHP